MFPVVCALFISVALWFVFSFPFAGFVPSWLRYPSSSVASVKSVVNPLHVEIAL